MVAVMLTPVPATADLKIEVVPRKAALSSTDPVPIDIVIRNTSGQGLKRVGVRVLRSGHGPPLRFRSRPRGRVAAHGAMVIAASAGPPAGGMSESAHVQVVAQARAPSGARLLAAAPLELQPPPAPRAPAGLEVRAVLSTLRSGQTSTAYAVVTNRSADTLTLGRLHVSGPSFLSFDGDAPKTLSPGRVAVVPVEVRADDDVRPGRHQLVLSLPVSTPDSSTTDLVAARTVEVGVAGESAVLIALGIPALILVPGFLVFATMSLLYRFRWLRKPWDGEAAPVEVASPEFWVAAVTASIVLLAAARLVSIDLLDTYSLEDVVWLWLFSVVLGAVVYAVWIGVRNRRRAKSTPSDGDAPVEVLEKLHRQGLDLVRERVELLAGEVPKVLYVLQPADEERQATWLGPPIELVWRQDDAELAKQIEADLDHTRNAGSLAATLRRGEQEGKLEVRFDGAARPYDRPRAAKADTIGASRGTDAIVHVAE